MSEAAAPPLTGIRVVDAGDEFAAYAARLLACLGADVVRVERPTRRGPARHPVARVGDENVSLFDAYVAAGSRSVTLDLATDEGRGAFTRLVDEADVVLCDADTPSVVERDDLVRVVVTPFGSGQSPAWGPVDDLIVLGAGGLLHLGGYTDSGPVAAFGGQSRFASGIFAAVAALVGLIQRERTGRAVSADVSAQEAVAQALEDSVPEFALAGSIREPQGDDAREAGTGIYRCADGYVSMVAGRLGTARAWESLVAWMREHEPTAETLSQPRWSEFAYRQTDEASAEFRRIFEAFAATRGKEQLYLEAQARQIALSPVNAVEDLLGDRQLAARAFFGRGWLESMGAEVTVPGPPFRLSHTPSLALGPSPAPARDEAWPADTGGPG